MSTSCSVSTSSIQPSKLAWHESVADAAWRLHDGMPAVWAAAAALVLILSSGAAVLLIAAILGWRP